MPDTPRLPLPVDALLLAPDTDAPPPEADPLDFQSHSIGYALRRAQMRAYELYYAMLGVADLTPARLTALSIIAMAPSMTQAALAKRLNITGPSVVKMVDALESTGLLCRVPCADDRRRYDLTLTDQGRAKLAQIRELIPGYEDEVTCKLSPEERRQLHALLNKMNDV